MKEIFFSPDFVPMWTDINTLASTLSMVALIATVIFTRRSVRLTSKAMQETLETFKVTFEASHYTELDAMYCDLLKEALKRPYLQKPKDLKDDIKKAEYNIYAFMIWNFLEAIHDRCKNDDKLKETWFPIIDAENRLHSEWFEDDVNKHKFKESFRNFIIENQFCP